MKHFLTSISIAFCALTLSAQTTQVKYISGTGADDTVQWDFKVSDGMNAGKWSKIEVPSQWETQGFGEYTYGRFYTVPGGRASEESGDYRYSFKVPSLWKGMDVDIVFDGVMTDALVKINGKQAGEIHQGAFYRFSYRVSDLLKYGASNKLEVHVEKQSANESVNAAERRADWWLFGGIFRPVWLRAMPKNHIENISLDPRADGTLSARIEASGTSGASVKYSLSDTDGRALGETVIALADEQKMKWDGVLAWECEHPHLYDLTVTLQDASGKALHSIVKRIGFRTVELRPKDGLYVNGTKVVLKGVNRHVFYPESGRTTSAAIDLEDARLIKQMNMNAIRSHYPPDDRFLDICDSLGIFYLDELAGWHGRYDNEVGPKLVAEMVARDVNHPSVIIWDNGNEGGWNTNLDHLFYDLDPQQRHVIHPWADFDDLDTHHYPTYLTGVGRFVNGYKVFMPTEFMHTNYDEGAGAGLEDFWANYTSHPLFAGGFIWAFVDEAVVRTDKGGILDASGNQGNDGIVGPYREKEASFWAIRDIWAPIQFEKTYITPSFNGDLVVKNTYLFSNLKDCTLSYKVYTVPIPSERWPQMTLAQGTVEMPDVEPGMTGKVHIPISENFFRGDVLELEAFAADGSSICTWTWPIQYAGEYYAKHQPKGSGGLSVFFDMQSGEIKGISKNGRRIPLTGFRPVGMQWKFKSASMRREGDDMVYVSKYTGGVDSVVWRVTADGRLGMDAVILNRENGGGGFDDAWMDPNVQYLGFTFDFPEDQVQGMKWMGRGPYRVWKNRIRGQNVSLWEKAYNNTITAETEEPYGRLEYPEFKGYHANMYWAQVESETSPFTVYTETDGLYLRMLTPEQPHRLMFGTSNPEFPEGDISFLLDIPAIKSFKPIPQQGPKSQPGNVRIKSGDEGLHITLWFDFGEEPELAATARPEAGSTRQGDNPVLFLVGDSTMRNGTKGNGDNGQWGWGRFAHEWFDEDRISVENQALGGLSSRTFYTGYWPDVIKGVQKGDYVILQLGHNDSGPVDSGRARNSLEGTGTETLDVVNEFTGETETVLTYGGYIRAMAKDVLAKGGHPIIFSLTPRPFRSEDGKLPRKTETFTAWEKAVAEELGIPYLDFEDAAARNFESFSKEKCAYMFRDNIHTSVFGAKENARVAAELIADCAESDLRDYLKPIELPKQPCVREEGKPALFFTGDSTMKNNDNDPDGMWGWGTVAGTVFDESRITLVNAGMAGRSARTFLDEGRWEKVYNALQPGDFVVIQFGHNDIGPINTAPARGEFPGDGDENQVFRFAADGRYEAVYSYGWYLRKFIDDAREKGATPILVSLTPRNEWPGGKMERRDDTYGVWVRSVVEKTGVDFVDMHNITADYYDSIGPEATKPYYKNDHTHSSRMGAERNAKSFAEGLKALEHPLAGYLK